MPDARAQPSRPRKKSQVTLGVLMLWILVASVYCWNLRILSDHQTEIEIIWEGITR